MAFPRPGSCAITARVVDREVVISHPRRPSASDVSSLQVVGPRLVEPAVMEPPHDSLPVKDDQVGIVFVLGRIGEPLLPVARAAIDRDDVVVEFCRRATAHPSVDEPPAERRQPADHRDFEERDVRPRANRRSVPVRPRFDRKARLVGEAHRDERDLARRRPRQLGVAARQELSLEYGKPIADPQGFLRGAGSKCGHRHHEDSNETCGGEDAGHGV